MRTLWLLPILPALGASLVVPTKPASVSLPPAKRVVVVETRIFSPDPQAGMKSRHTVIIDPAACTADNQFQTGTTYFFGTQLNSVRNNFKATNVRCQGGNITLEITGETASGVGVVPNINYDFVVTLGTSEKVAGCHDGYPGYSVTIDDKPAYTFRHKPKDLLSLFGSCDIRVG